MKLYTRIIVIFQSSQMKLKLAGLFFQKSTRVRLYVVIRIEIFDMTFHLIFFGFSLTSMFCCIYGFVTKFLWRFLTKSFWVELLLELFIISFSTWQCLIRKYTKTMLNTSSSFATSSRFATSSSFTRKGCLQMSFSISRIGG